MASGGEDRSQLIAHFQEITGIEDESKILEHLSSHHWNLEAAVQDALNEKEGIRPIFTPSPSRPHPPSSSQHSSTRSSGSSINSEPSTGRSRAVVQRESWLAWTANLAVYPLRLVLSAANEVFQLIVSLLFGAEPAVSENPHQDTQQFITEFESQFGANHPPFLVMSYDEALSQARKDLQFLLVYIHSPGHQDTRWFCQEVLCSQQFVEFVSSNGMLCLGVSIKTQEGVRVSYILRENTYPFLALVVLKQSRLVVCERIEGALSLGELTSRLRSAIADNEGEFVVERTERFRRLEDQQLREAQDQAFQESLAADREKERLREEGLSKAEELAHEQERLQKQQEKAKEDFEVEKAIRVSRLPPEPEAGDPEVMQVMLRLPSGHRLERWFRSSDNLQCVYDFAFTDESGQLPMTFTLVANFPRKELVVTKDGGPTLKELNLGKRCALFVQDDTA